ncbi:uncharacterized protein LOC101890984 [Musca domestica]|uniref:Uncharacterized protein LOC101890984 n=1 Tax=Musca domestica TaxID=7370 RepID=A0A1I8MNU9_MUSDO|nr:uncharacterized protein LOC101890984 [Musca domestica]
MQSSWKTLEYLFYLGIFILLLKFSESASIDVETTTERSSNENRPSVKQTLEECNTSFSWICLKIEFVKILEYLTEREELRLLNGISLVKDPEAKEIKTSELMADVARSYPNDPNARINGFIVNKINNFLQTHYLRFKLIDDKTVMQARSLVETGRKDKFGKKGGMEMLLAAGLMMKGTLMAMGMGGIALMAGKALMAGLMALTLSAVIGLKSLAGGGGKSHTYEIVTKPIYTSSHSHSGGHDDGHIGHVGHSGSGYAGYGRSLNLNLPASLKENKVH